MTTINIGTSGWMYKHWRKLFYPRGLPQSQWLEYFSKYFSTVEVNNTFYRMPEVKIIKSWYERSPKDFVLIVKGNRYITHIKKLNPCKETEMFLDTIKILKEKLGPILFQLPPSLKKDNLKLENFCKLLPKQFKYCVEFRHPSW